MRLRLFSSGILLGLLCGAAEYTKHGGSCGDDGIPYLISIDLNGRPGMPVVVSGLCHQVTYRDALRQSGVLWQEAEVTSYSNELRRIRRPGGGLLPTV